MKKIVLLLLLTGLILSLMAACTAPAAEPTVTAAPDEVDSEEPASEEEAPMATATEPPPTATESPPTMTPSPEATATEEPPTATDEPATEPAPTETAAPPTETPPAATGESEPLSNGRISIQDFQFAPGDVTVEAGTTVVWTHVGNINHTVTADDGSFDSGMLGGGDVFQFTFTTPGTYAYYCELHGGAGQSGMSGVITVVEN